MRVVLTSNFSPWSAYSGGGQRSTHELATALARQGHDVSVVFTRPPWERFTTPATEYNLHWAGFFDRKSRRQAPLRPLNALTVLRQVQRLHAQAPLDAVHGNGEEVVLAARWASARGVSVVTTPRYPNYPAIMLRPGGARRMAWLRLLVSDAKYLVLAEALRWSTWCCPTSEYAAGQARLALQAEPSRMRVVPNGVANAFFEALWAPSPSLRPLLFFGRLARDKGLDVLLKALARLNTSHTLVIVGRGDEEARLRQLASDLGVARRISWRPWLGEVELANALIQCSIAVLPSRHESFGNSMAESMAVGVPLVSTRVGSIPEIVEHGVSGLLVPKDNPDALSAAVSKLEANPELAQRLGAVGRQRMQSNHTWAAVARRYAELYAMPLTQPPSEGG